MKIVFCLPGSNFSGRFLSCWTELLHACQLNDIQIILSQQYSPLLYYVRNLCLGGNYLEGINQKPFQGKLDYDYIMWIDSDTIFTPDQFFKLINNNKDIVSGLYMMQDNINYATVENWNRKNNNNQFITRESLKQKRTVFTVDYTGFGFILMKKGVFESLEYPWFQPMWTEYELDGKTIRDFSMEDAAFCSMIKEKNYDIWIDPEVIVGHEKMMILY